MSEEVVWSNAYIRNTNKVLDRIAKEQYGEEYPEFFIDEFIPSEVKDEKEWLIDE